jgi:hypothetical protein
VKSKKIAKAQSKKGPKAKRASMPKFFRIDEEMKQWASLLEGELVQWPGVKTKPMFGLISLFRGKSIFAAVPRTRALRSPQSIILKFNPVPAPLIEKIKTEPRISDRAPGPGAGWHAFELRSREDIEDALWWLNQAYECTK